MSSADILDILVATGFTPLDGTYPDEVMTAREVGILDYMAAGRWGAARIEAGTTDDWATLVRWGDDGIDVIAIDRNGVPNRSAQLTSASWLAKLLA